VPAHSARDRRRHGCCVTPSLFAEIIRDFADKFSVTGFFRRAEEILETAVSGPSSLSNVLMVLDRRGGLHIMESAGWSLPAVAAEFGADAVYSLEHRGSLVRVEGWSGSERCVLQGRVNRRPSGIYPGAFFTPPATLLQLAAATA
jgi:hypothetical protein